MAPGAVSNFVKLLPVAFLPSGHNNLNFRENRLLIIPGQIGQCRVWRRTTLVRKQQTSHDETPAMSRPAKAGRLRTLDAHDSEKVHRRHYRAFPRERKRLW